MVQWDDRQPKPPVLDRDYDSLAWSSPDVAVSSSRDTAAILLDVAFDSCTVDSTSVSVAECSASYAAF